VHHAFTAKCLAVSAVLIFIIIVTALLIAFTHFTHIIIGTLVSTEPHTVGHVI